MLPTCIVANSGGWGGALGDKPTEKFQ